MYCFSCGALMTDGAAFCSNCRQSFSVALAAGAPTAAGLATVPRFGGVAVGSRVEYAGFWLRFLALLIDNVLLGLSVVLVLIPVIFLTGLGSLLSRIRPQEGLEDAGIFLIVGTVFLAATIILLLTWLYHALMESSKWQATVGKKALGLVVTDMVGQRVSFGRSTGRHFGKMITNLIPVFIGYIMAGFTEKRQALHDMMAGCLVLRRIG